jgi:trimeric autotransporter adhesin
MAGDTNYDPVTSAAVAVALTKAEQTTLIAVATPNPVTYGNTSALTSTGGTVNGAVTFSAGASTGCSVIGTTLSVTDASGTCAITATMAGNNNYNAVTSAALSVGLVKADQAALTALATPNPLTYGNTSALSSSGGTIGAVTFSVGSSTGCTVSGSTLSVSDASGTCAITATRAGNNNYNPITSPSVTVVLAKADQAALGASRHWWPRRHRIR